MSNTPIGNTKKKLDLDKLSDNIKTLADNKPQEMPNALGIAGDNIAELNPVFDILPTEVVYSGKYDASIVLGRDRAGQFFNEGGYGLIGHTSCAAIDIVVGRKASDDKFDIQKGKRVAPDFVTDAARVYISQKSDIDSYLSLPAGNSGITTVRSTVAAKADAVRLVARESMKLVVGTDYKTSQGNVVQSKVGIELMAGDLELCQRAVSIADSAEQQREEIELGGMQPIPLGVNLSFALDQMVEKIDKLSGIVSSAAMIMINFMNATVLHTHPDGLHAFHSVPPAPSTDYDFACQSAGVELMQYTVADINLFRKELISFKFSHLKPSGAYYINSRFHTLN
jgi:hypothetical protein